MLLGQLLAGGESRKRPMDGHLPKLDLEPAPIRAQPPCYQPSPFLWQPVTPPRTYP